MKNTKLAFIGLLLFGATSLKAQESTHLETRHHEQYGNTLNLAIGIGYYGYMGHSSPVLHIDYEINVARNFTLAPFLAYYSYDNNYYWGDPHNPYRDYLYTETVMPIGLKGTYYFDDILGAGPRWDFYLAGSLGFAIRSTTWPDGYGGSTTLSDGPSPLFLDLHIGTEYHLSHKAGLFLDLSTGMSTFGLGIHF